MTRITPSQQNVYFESRLYGDSINNIGGYLVISTAVDMDSFKQARQTLFESNDAFRLVLKEKDDRVTLGINGQVLAELQLVEFDTEDNPMDSACSWMKKEFSRLFPDYQQGLVKDALLKISESEFIYFAKAHHLILDGWGFSLWGQRLFQLYKNIQQCNKFGANGFNYPSYLDYAKSIENYENSQRYQRDKNYWLDKYQSIPESLLEPKTAENPNEHLEVKPSERLGLSISPEKYHQLIQLAGENNIGMLQIFLGIIYLYFTRVYNQSELVFGLPVHNRSSASLKKVIGLLMNVNANRFSCSKILTFIELSQAISSQLKKDYRYQGYPINHLNRDLELLKLDRQQLFDISFNYQVIDLEMTLDDKPITSHYLGNGLEQTPLVLTLCEYDKAQNICLHMNYQKSYWHKAEAKRLLSNLENILNQILVNPSKCIRDYTLVTEQEKLWLYDQGRGPQCRFPDKTIFDYVFEYSKVRPEKPAVIYDGQSLNYAALESASQQLAIYLSSQGITVNDRIGIGLERSSDLIISLLAVMKIGAVFVPLVADLPSQRLVKICRDANLSGILTVTAHSGFFVEIINTAELFVRLYCVDDTTIMQKKPSIQNSLPDISGRNERLAYIYYTSGSTGTPKGVVVSHTSFINLLHSVQCRLDLDESVKLLSVTTPGFDIVLLELFIPLLCGGVVVLSTTEESKSGDRLIALIEEYDVNILQATPASWQLLLDAKWSGKKTLTALCGGEALSVDLARELILCVNCLWNCYGPTEATIWSMICEVDHVADYELVPMGNPLANTEHYVLNLNQELVPKSVIGELYIGGIGLARAYLNLPEHSKERFIQHPLFIDFDHRVYRTGDLVRYLENGLLEFLGRVDDQVKVHGHRIELEEIEHWIHVHDDVSQVIVNEQNNLLVAYIIPHESVGKDFDELILDIKAHVKEHLPRYMIPTIFIEIESIPLTANGKVDRNSLFLHSEYGGQKQQYIAPRNITEEKLCTIWENVLKLERVGIYDNYFQLGANSLLVARVISMVRQQLNIELSFRGIFKFQCVSDLYNNLDKCKNQPIIPPIDIIESRGNLPLSYAQQRLWFIDQLEGGSPQYNMPGAFTLVGILKKQAFKQTFKTILERHEVLRTNFKEEAGESYQVIQTNILLPLIDIDLCKLNSKEQKCHIAELIDANVNYQFDLKRDVLIRVHLLRLSIKEYMMLFNMHHIASDGWSISVLINEFSQLYTAFSQGDGNPLSTLPIQYADYAHWQRQWLQGDMLDKQLMYWKSQLSGIPQVHSLLLDKPRPVRQSFHGCHYGQVIGKTLAMKIHELCQQCGVTLFIFLQTTFSLLLSRYSNETDVVMGTPIAGRIYQDIESLIGFFVNTLVLRTNLDGNPSFSILLQNNKQCILDAYAYQQLPFEILVEELQPERSLSHSPVLQIMLTLQNHEGGELTLPELTLKPMQQNNSFAKFDISLSVIEFNDCLSLNWLYSTDLFYEETISRMADSFSILLQGVVENPGQSIHTLPLLTEAQQYSVLMEWNDTQIEYQISKCFHELFEEQVERNPCQIAVVIEEQQLTYKELNERANQLAHYLIERGVKPDTLVGLCVDRSLKMIIGLMGILKAGGAYVPLDPNYPMSRLAYMLEDSAIEFVLSQQQRLRSCHYINVHLDVDYLENELQCYSKENPKPKILRLDDNHLAYVIYTSGSTGQPNGIMIEHRSVCNLARNICQWLNRENSKLIDIWIMNASINFDASVKAISQLSEGIKIILLSDEEKKTFSQLTSILNRHPSALFDCTPTQLSALLDADNQLLSLNAIIGGELLSDSLYNKLRTLKNDNILMNVYGPTETCVNTTICHITEDGVRASIGKFLDNVYGFVLNVQLELAPIGAIGELFIGGIGLARGYINQAELTKNKFIHNPYSSDPEDRLYTTGDLVRWLPDGNLEFMGRMDHQVKIRGFRIELGEIEVQLVKQDCIKETVVLARESTDEDKYLVAYVVFHSNDEKLASPDQRRLSEIKDELKLHLPNYMIPSCYVALDNLPLTPNGKVDRKALPSPTEYGLQKEVYVAPRNAIEEKLCEIWQAVLKLDQIGIHDDFFKLGGHSLLATRLISLVRQELGTEIPLRTLFESPTVSDLSDALQLLSIKSLLPAITIIDNRKRLPLSYAQQRLWFIDQLEGRSTQYNMPGVFKLVGKLKKRAFKQALKTILERHEILRTNFKETKGEAYQVIQSKVSFPLIDSDLSHYTHEEQHEHLDTLIHENINYSFNLKEELLLRVHLLRLSAKEHVVLFNKHHIVSDGWSISLLINEISQLYTAFSQGLENPLSPLKVQYADYAYWQRQWLQGDILEKQLSYWKVKLADIPQVHSLALDKPRPTHQSFTGNNYEQVIDQGLTNGISQLCEQQNVTLFMFLQTAFTILLGRYSNETDIVIGSPIAGRFHKDIESLIGFFVNTLVLRSNLEGNPAFKALLQENKRHILDAFTHQYIPFEMLVEELQPQRSLSHSPMFQILLTLQNNEEGELTLPDLILKPVAQNNNIVKFDLGLTVQELKGKLALSWSYNTGLFYEDSISRMSDNFAILLDSIVNCPEQSIQSLPLLTSEEQHRLLVDWNDTRVEYLKDRCVHELFEEQSERTPNNVALVFEDDQLTYQALNKASNRLAHYLREQGVGAETLVGIGVTRSMEFIIGVLAILKAGGAYLPLDPYYPKARLQYMLEDSGLKYLLTLSGLATEFNLRKDVKVIMLNTEMCKQKLQTYPVVNPKRTAAQNSDNLVYVIYTSGSTGQPKGVMVEHRSVNNNLNSQIDYYGYKKSSIFIFYCSYCFDGAVEEYLLPLVFGARVIIFDQIEIFDLELFISSLVNFGVTKANISPTLLSTSKAVLSNIIQFSALKTLVLGGEKLSNSLAKQMVDVGYEVVNSYGPTESTIDVVRYRYEKRIYNNRSLIGKPIWNSQVYVLNETLDFQPIGILGELHIAGIGLARGYLNQAEMTTEKFIRNPFSTNIEERLYKTGDLVRWLADGNLEYMGRIDHQTKIRGFRIEQGEIETCLLQCSDIQESVVYTLEKDTGEKFLVAYIILKRANNQRVQDDFISNIKTELKKHLPDYMVPSTYVILDAFPLTPNGKIDRQALPLPDDRHFQKVKYVAPYNQIEKTLCELWQNILKLEQVGRHDNFFELGGHSLLVTRLISVIRQALEVELPIRALFEHPTVAGLAEIIHDVDGGQILPAITVVDNRERLPLSFAQQRLWFLDQLEGGSSQYNISGGFKLVGNFKKRAFKQTLKTILDRHEVLRTNIKEEAGEAYQVIQSRVCLPLVEFDLSGDIHEEQNRRLTTLIDEDVNYTFDLKVDVLLRVHLLRIASKEHVVLFNMHHIVSDGWSISLLINEISQLYTAFSQGMKNPLSPLNVQYSDYAHWQRQWLQRNVLEKQLSYWKMQLADIPQVHSLALDKPRPTHQSFIGNDFEQVVDQALTKQIGQLCEQHDVTLFMFLQTAFTILLGRYSNETDIVIGSHIAGRFHKDIESLIGFFVNTLALRSDLEGNPSFAVLLQKNKQHILDAYTHQHIPFEMLVEELQPTRSLSHSPLFQILLTLQNNETGECQLPDLILKSVEQNSTMVKFDMELTAVELNEGLSLRWLYNTGLFYEETIRGMAESFRVLIQGIMENPDQTIQTLPLLTEEQQHCLLVEWNDTQVEYPKKQCIYELFEQQVERSPDQVAVVFEDGQLTYQELNEKANQLAHCLMERGVKPNTLVGHCVERSMEMVIGLLSILKAGGTYVPIDPAYPKARIAYLFEDSATTIVLTQRHLVDQLPGQNLVVLSFDEDMSGYSNKNLGLEYVGLTSSHLAYVMYTSGSTGLPKGVVVTQSNLQNLLLAVQNRLQLQHDICWLSVTTSSFDISLLELLMPLVIGGQLIVASQEEVASGFALMHLLEKYPVDVLQATPASWDLLMNAQWRGNLQLNALCGGEALRNSLSLSLIPKVKQLWNCYGPTEATIWSLVRPVDGETIRDEVAIGGALSNTRHYVLDGYKALLPVGAIGELHIGGYGLAEGYLNQPELNRVQFINDPFSDDSESRLYRTGDLVRCLSDGDFEFMGRIDYQVKIRGFRIDLGEIENRLSQCEGIQDSVVVTLKEQNGDSYLVAYVTVMQSDDNTQSELIKRFKTELRKYLPDYMIPSIFVVLDTLPLMINGKIDRKALPPPDESMLQKMEYVEPRNFIEKKLVKIWKEILNLETIGVHDDFFELGGHSLLATRVVSAIDQAFQLNHANITLKYLFENPTIEVISDALRTNILMGRVEKKVSDLNDDIEEGEF